jgi:hypothetical protein
MAVETMRTETNERSHPAFWPGLGSIMGVLKETFARHGFGLAMYVLMSVVLIFVPQIADILWKLPYRIGAGNVLDGIGFWIYVPFLALFFYTSWMTLARVSGLGVTRLVGVTCALILILLLFAPAADSLWSDLFGNSIWAAVSFYTCVPMFVILYFFSWFFLTLPDECWDANAMKKGFPAWFLKQRARYWPASAKPEDQPEAELPYDLTALSSRGARLLLLLALPIAVVNLLLLALNYAVCGFWVELLATAARRHSRLAPGAAVAVFLLVAAGYLMFARTNEIGLYPGSHAFFGLIFLPLGGLCVWIAAVAWHVPQGDATKLLDPVGEVSGRFLVLLVAASLFGEMLWASASMPFLDQFISYRLYTIWAAFHLSFAMFAVGTWADVTQRDWQHWPMRPLTLATMVVLILVFVKSTTLDPSGQDAGAKIWDASKQQDATPGNSLNWYQHVWDRLEAMDKKGQGPVLVVAASGGGSRAALFTALVLEGMDKTPFPNLKDNTWSDRTLLVSGVSGGSLASAHVEFRKGKPLATAAFLRNSMQGELFTRFDGEYDNIKGYYADDELDKLSKSFAELHDPRQPDPDLNWILTSATADDMCTDFMAPLFRGALTFQEERGQAVSRFWQQRFAWINPDDQKPYHNLSPDAARPLVIFNTTDARRGNRFLLGFPQLPRRMSTMHLGRVPYSTIKVQGSIGPGDLPATKNERPTKVHIVWMREGNNYTLAMKRIEDKTSKQPRLDPYLEIKDPFTDESLAHDDDSGGELNARISNFVAPKDGDYRVLASALSGQGDYTLTVKQNFGLSPVIAQSENNTYNEKLPYTQALADFWPCLHLELNQAVRASANFPWGFQSCYLTRSVQKYDFRKPALRQALAKYADKLIILLPRELNLLTLEKIPNVHLKVDGQSATSLDKIVASVQEDLSQAPDPARLEKQVQTLDQIARNLEQLTLDAHAPKAYREQAREILDSLQAAEKPTRYDEQIFLLDGGVNDNTGIPSLVEVFQHLEAAATIEDPLIDPSNKKLAAQIMNRLRERGVIFLEIDSGAKPKSGVLHDLQTPLQALENANFVNAAVDRERYLKRINKLLTPAAFQKEGAGNMKGLKKTGENANNGKGQKKSGPKDLPWVFHHLFLCNHSNDRDVMTAWALSPGDKARVMATFFCEYQKWRKEQSDENVQEWLRARNKEQDPGKSPRATPTLDAFASQLHDYDRRRVEQQSNILKSQKALK